MNTNQLTGNIGLFYACYYLSWIGWNVMPTTRNAKGPDIFLLAKDCRTIGIQVKSLSNTNDVFLGANFSDESTDYWIIVVGVRADGKYPDAFIIPSEDIVKSANFGHCTNEDLVYFDEKNGKKTYYINRRFLNDKSIYFEAWDTYLSFDKNLK